MKMLPEERRSQVNIEAFRSSMTKVLRTGEANWLNQLMDVQILHQDGNKRFIQQVAFPIRTAKGFMLGSIIRDITTQKQIEIERESLIRKLESQNAELERFTYTVSHDLKAPLVTIRGFLGYLIDDAKSGKLERMQDDIQRIERATDKMQSLLKDLLELSRVGRLINSPEEIEFEALVHEAIDMTSGVLEKQGVQVEVASDLPNVRGDRQRLLEVVQNLLDNAAKFMGDQPNPQIEIGQYGEEDDMLIFFVRDNGIGIAPKHHEEVFGLFNKLNLQIEGTGVGLALVKRIIEFHGGRIWIESEAGQGSTFYFTLPNHNAV
jgi:signal transduction histidine kinase